MSEILIVSSEADAHARVVAWSLRQAGHEVTFWDTSHAIQAPGFSVRTSPKGGTKIAIAGKSEFKSAWLRRVFHTRKFNGTTAIEDRDYISGESRRYVDNVLERMAGSGVRWLNNKRSAIAGEYKLEQLEACACLGIRFPETIISNDPDSIRDFVRRLGKVVVKPIDVFTWKLDDGAQLMTYANTLTKEQLADMGDAELLACPAIYQEVIEKVFDLRVVAIGGDVFACRIQNPHADCVDFRPFQTDGTLHYERYEVGPELRRSVLRLKEHFSLEMVSSDFCVAENGEIYFLDLNPGGAFLFVEFYGGGSIVSHVAGMLAGEDPSRFPGLEQYNAWASEENRIGGA